MLGLHLPIASLPKAQLFSQVPPATHFIAISRGIIIRGAVCDLWRNVAALLVIALLSWPPRRGPSTRRS
jgi:hypothetical protein